jgi:hypothetical protein
MSDDDPFDDEPDPSAGHEDGFPLYDAGLDGDPLEQLLFDAEQPPHEDGTTDYSPEPSDGIDVGDEIIIEAGDDSDGLGVDIATFDDTGDLVDNGSDHAGAWLFSDGSPLPRAFEPADVSALWAGAVAIDPVDDFADPALLGDREPVGGDDNRG